MGGELLWQPRGGKFLGRWVSGDLLKQYERHDLLPAVKQSNLFRIWRGRHVDSHPAVFRTDNNQLHTMTHCHRVTAACQQGITLLEVLIAMLVFLIGASAMTLLAGNAFTANAQASRTFVATSTSQSLLATVEGNPQVLASLDGTALGTASGTAAPGVLQTWWTAQHLTFPDLQGVQLNTQPNPCSATSPCQITAIVYIRSAFGGTLQRTFLLQDGF